MTKEQNIVMQGNEKTDELPKEAVDVVGGQITAARAVTKGIYASIEYAVHFHVQVEY